MKCCIEKFETFFSHTCTKHFSVNNCQSSWNTHTGLLFTCKPLLLPTYLQPAFLLDKCIVYVSHHIDILWQTLYLLKLKQNRVSEVYYLFLHHFMFIQTYRKMFRAIIIHCIDMQMTKIAFIMLKASSWTNKL